MKRAFLAAMVLGLALLAGAQETPAVPPAPLSLLPEDLVGSQANHESARPQQFADPVYPEKALKAGVQGVVLLFVDVRKDGKPAHISVASGVDPLAKATVHAVQQWRYQPYLLQGKPTEFTVVVRTRFLLPPGGAPFVQVTFPTGVVVPGVPVQEGRPEYPAIARAARVQGTVVFRCVIDRQGTVRDPELVSGHPLLVDAARAAVLQWRYRPCLMDGEPVAVRTEVNVVFTLGGGQ